MLIFALAIIAHAQNYQTVEQINTECAQLGFQSNAEAEIAVDDILAQLGLARNFIVIECPDIKNAVAKIIEDKNGVKERYILYDNTFFQGINSTANTDWAARSILAHEIGHHLNNHSLNNVGSNHKFELEADEFSGFVLAKMGATLEQAQSALATLKYEKATRTHPSKADRLARTEKGWLRAKGNSVSNNDNANDIIPEKEEEVPFAVLEKLPVFPGCNGSNLELKKCFNQGISKVITENFDFDLPAKLGYKTGKVRVLLQWTINKFGYISNVKARAPDDQLAEEAIRIIRLIPKMEPGRQKGKDVAVRYSMPLTVEVE